MTPRWIEHGGGEYVVLLLHAMSKDATDWDAVATALAIEHRVLALNLLGDTFEAMRDEVLAVVDELDLDRIDLVGHSMGGTVAYLVAEARPDLIRRLVLEDTPPPRGRSKVELPPDTQEWARVRSIVLQLNDPDPRWWDDLPRITSHVLVIGGGSESHVAQDELAAVTERIPHARLLTIGGGHLVHKTRTEEYIAAVVPFLDQHVRLNGSERDLLESFLDTGRESVLRRLSGLTDAQATALPIPSCDLSVAGVVKHLARVEDMWFHEKFALQPRPEPWASMPDEPDWEIHSARDDTVADVRALYLAACARSRVVAARHELDDETTRVSFGKGTPSLRRIFLGVHQETVHHMGHLDLLRDAVLGT